MPMLPNSAPAISAYRHILAFSVCVIFIACALYYTVFNFAMFGDTDPLWHIATGDLIRSQHAIPQHDPWSFTAGDYPWFVISWAWEVAFSYLHEQLGWYGVIAVNAMIIASIIALIYLNCIMHSHDFFASIITTAIAAISCLLRPLQVTDLMVAIWMLLLSAVMRGKCSVFWVALLPVLEVIWVNMHGGCLIGPFLLGAFALQAFYDHRYALGRHLLLAAIMCAGALLCNPYGIYYFDVAWRSSTFPGTEITKDWRPFVMSMGNFIVYFNVVAFPILVLMRRPSTFFACERYLAWLWFILTLLTFRHITIFAIISAPLIACSIPLTETRHAGVGLAQTIVTTMLRYCNCRVLSFSAVAICISMWFWLPGPMMARYIKHPDDSSFAILSPEIAFLKEHYPKAHILNDFVLGGFLVYQTRGDIPVFIDPRAAPVYPASVLKDYLRFIRAEPGWEDILDRYDIQGVMLHNDRDYSLLDRFKDRQGWKKVFTGPRATIFIRVHT